MYVVYCQNKPKSEHIVSEYIETYFEVSACEEQAHKHMYTRSSGVLKDTQVKLEGLFWPYGPIYANISRQTLSLSSHLHCVCNNRSVDRKALTEPSILGTDKIGKDLIEKFDT